MLTCVLVCLYPAIVAANVDGLAELTLSGTVKVNGERVNSSSTFASGGRIETAWDSEAVVNVPGKGKIQLLQKTELTFRFSENSFVVMLSRGSVKIMTFESVKPTVTTRNATIVGDSNGPKSFSVRLACENGEDCGATIVETYDGSLDVITNLDNMRKTITAGVENNNTTVLDPCKTQCRDMGVLSSSHSSGGGLGRSGLFGLILGAVGALVVGAILSGDEQTSNGKTPTVSPFA